MNTIVISTINHRIQPLFQGNEKTLSYPGAPSCSPLKCSPAPRSCSRVAAASSDSRVIPVCISDGGTEDLDSSPRKVQTTWSRKKRPQLSHGLKKFETCWNRHKVSQEWYIYIYMYLFIYPSFKPWNGMDKSKMHTLLSGPTPKTPTRNLTTKNGFEPAIHDTRDLTRFTRQSC